MVGWRRADGQAAAELVAVLPLVVGVLACAWQLVLLGHTALAAGTAAHAAARARALGLDAQAAARAPLPGRLEPGLRVRAGAGGAVEVVVRIPTLPGIPPLGHVQASARFAPQT